MFARLTLALVVSILRLKGATKFFLRLKLLKRNMMSHICCVNAVRKQMLALLDYVNRFYEDPKNKQAYDAWKAKEETNEDHDHP